MSAFLLLLTICFYFFIYTVWLKRRTPQNIVIGGAAGALPPVIQNSSGTEIGQFCRAWVFFDDNGTILQSSSTNQAFNVSSVSDQGSSEYHITFATAFPDKFYMPVVQASSNDDGRAAISSSNQNSSTVCKLYTRSGFTSSRSDATNNMVTIWSVV